MIRNRWMSVAAGRPAMAREGAAAMEYLLGGALTVVIIAALVLTISMGFKGETGHVDLQEDEKVTFINMSTGEEVGIVRKEIPPDIVRQEGFDMLMRMEAKDGSGLLVQALKCPKCGKNYVPPAWEEAPEAVWEGLPGANYCDKCDTDIGEYYRTKR